MIVVLQGPRVLFLVLFAVGAVNLLFLLTEVSPVQYQEENFIVLYLLLSMYSCIFKL